MTDVIPKSEAEKFEKLGRENGQVDTLVILPCPFCGEQPIILETKERDDIMRLEFWNVACNCPDCLMLPHTGNRETESEAIEAWNQRAI